MDEASTLTRQMSLDLTLHTHGGARFGAGRPRKKDSERRFIAHRVRPVHRMYEPVHVTMRVIKGLPSLRSQVLARIINRCMLAQRKKLSLEEKAHFQIVDFNIQANHLHLIVEAPDKSGLARGLMGLAIRISVHLNRKLQRKGRLWADRYHRHDLRTPREARNALRYVLFNSKKHFRVIGEPFADPCSSATEFDGFSSPPIRGSDALEWPPVPPLTWLRRVGWRRHGLIDPSDAPWSRAA